MNFSNPLQSGFCAYTQPKVLFVKIANDLLVANFEICQHMKPRGFQGRSPGSFQHEDMESMKGRHQGSVGKGRYRGRRETKQVQHDITTFSSLKCSSGVRLSPYHHIPTLPFFDQFCIQFLAITAKGLALLCYSTNRPFSFPHSSNRVFLTITFSCFCQVFTAEQVGGRQLSKAFLHNSGSLFKDVCTANRLRTQSQCLLPPQRADLF